MASVPGDSPMTTASTSRTRSVRAATTDDSEALLSIRRRAILELAPPALTLAQARTWASPRDVVWMRQVIETQDVWVAHDDGEPLGWAVAESNTLIGLYTDPRVARRGVGSRLLAFVEERVVSHDAEALDLEASVNAEAFYIARGYHAYTERSEDGTVRMRKPLRRQPVNE